MSQSPTTSVELTLPIGYEDKAGVIHQDVVMRKVRNSDIIAVQSDLTMKSIIKEYSNTDLSIDPIRPDPAKAIVVNSIVTQMFTLLFCRVIIKIGDVEHINRSVIMEFYQEDMQFLMRSYGTLNGVDVDEMMKAPLAVS